MSSAGSRPIAVDVQAVLTLAAGALEPGGRLVGAHELTGGVSADVFALDIETARGETRRVVFRRHRGEPDEDARRSALMEQHLLGELHRRGFAVPEPYRGAGADRGPESWFTMEWIEGTTHVAAADLPDALWQMARFLVALHAIDPPTLSVPELAPIEDPVEAIGSFLSATPTGAAVRARVDAGAFEVGHERTVLLHGDYWPGNVLWRDGRLAAVIDWEDASVGDALADLATARVELECRHGTGAMERFTDLYVMLRQEAGTPVELDGLTIWDLYVSAAALATMHTWGLDAGEEAQRRLVTERFFDRAARAVA